MASEISNIDITGDGSVVKVVTKSGHGKEMPEIGDTCSVHYVGRVAGAKKPFDSSGTKPFSFDVGGPVIKGWNEAIKTMVKGEKATVTIQPEKGYGKKGAGEEIPPNSVLEFDMELVSFEKKASKEKKQNENKKNKLPEGVKKTKTLKEGIEPDVDSDKFMISPEDLTPVILHYKISLETTADGAIPDAVFDSEAEDKAGVKIVIDECMWPDGLDAAVKAMKKEEQSVFTITAAMAWGENGCEAKGVPPNSDIIVEITLLDFEHRPRVQDLPNEEKFVQSEKFRVAGNEYFGRGDIPRAQRRYSKALQMIQVNYDYTLAEKERSREMGQVTYRNRSLCYIRMGEPHKAEADCKMAITLNPSDMIALYRHALALIAIEENWDKAKLELQKVVKTLKARGKSARQASKALKQLERKMENDYKKQKKLFGGFLHKENPAVAVEDREQRIAATSAPPPTSRSSESVSVSDGAAASAQSNAKRKSDRKKAAQTRRKMKLELYPDKKDTRKSTPTTAELVSDLSNDEDIELDQTRLSNPCVQAAHKAMRWQVLLAYVSVHSVFALFLLGVSLLVPDSEVAKTQLVTLLLLDGLMTLSACQARKAQGVNRYVKPLALLSIGLCIHYRGRLSQLSQSKSPTMVVLKKLHNAELAAPLEKYYREGFFGIPYFEFYILTFLIAWATVFFFVATVYLGPRWICEILKTQPQAQAEHDTATQHGAATQATVHQQTNPNTRAKKIR